MRDELDKEVEVARAKAELAAARKRRDSLNDQINDARDTDRFLLAHRLLILWGEADTEVDQMEDKLESLRQ